jgi:membrane-associated phospholipid phosphatase
VTTTDHVAQLVLSVVLIVGAYQFYFWCQRHPLAPARELGTALDARVPFRPRWVWVYSALYYPVILYVNWIVESPGQYLDLALSYLGLLGLQMVCFLAFPVVTPAAWRAQNPARTWSERFLAFVQRFDARSNSFPSMHTSVAMLTALHLYPRLGAWAFAFPVLIGVSCLFTKQHYVIDLPAGAGLGWLAYHAFPAA